MRSKSKRRIGRKKRTLKIRGGNLDNPDTKDFMNSKIADLEQKIADMPLYIGYSMHTGLIFAPKDCDEPFFRQIIIFSIRKLASSGNNYDPGEVHISLQKLYSLPNLRGIGLHTAIRSHWPPLEFTPLEEDDRELIRSRQFDALMEKYPGLFFNYK